MRSFQMINPSQKRSSQLKNKKTDTDTQQAGVCQLSLADSSVLPLIFLFECVCVFIRRVM